MNTDFVSLVAYLPSDAMPIPTDLPLNGRNHLKYFDRTNGIGVTSASRLFLLTSTWTDVPFL